MHTPDELVGLYRARGYKITPQRQMVFSVLHENPTHPSAEAVHSAVVEQMGSVSLRTVYSILTELAEMGEILQHDLGTKSARFDPNVTDHHHAVCDVCGSVRDVDFEMSAIAPTLTNQVSAEVVGFEVTAAAIVFRGRCAECAQDPHPGTTDVIPTTERGLHG